MPKIIVKTPLICSQCDKHVSECRCYMLKLGIDNLETTAARLEEVLFLAKKKRLFRFESKDIV